MNRFDRSVPENPPFPPKTVWDGKGMDSRLENSVHPGIPALLLKSLSTKPPILLAIGADGV